VEDASYIGDIQERIVHPVETEKYDLSLYTIPWSESMPESLRYTIQYAVFIKEELTPEMVARRVWLEDDSYEVEGYRTMSSVGVLIDDTIFVSIQTKGLSAQQIYELLTQCL